MTLCWPFAPLFLGRSSRQTCPEKADATSVRDRGYDASSDKNEEMPPGVSYYMLETSAKQIYSRRRKILDPEKHWTKLSSERDAECFVRMTPIRDTSRQFAQSRFRILAVQYSDMRLLYAQKALLQAAKAAGWISNVFETFIENHTTGSAVRESSTGLSFVAQTPHDDMFPFFSLSLAAHHGYGYENAPDWTAIVFLGPSSRKHRLDIGVLSSLLDNERFPGDYPASLSPDLMLLAVVLMRHQVGEIASGIAAMRKGILEVDDELLDPRVYEMRRLRQVKSQLFTLRRTQGALYQRHLFAVELASSLWKTFEMLRKRARGEAEEPSIEYSETLREAVQALSFILETLKHEVTVASPRIEAQQTMLDGQTNIMIANNSYYAAEEARRDSASMRTIAVVTLVFLPGAFVATIFSMSMFQWMPGDGSGGSDDDAMQHTSSSSRVVSGWFWLYWAITAPLTTAILMFWVLWSRRTQTEYKERRERELLVDEETRIE